MSKFLKEEYKGLKAYTPGEQPGKEKAFIKLNTNESPYPPSPKVFEALGFGSIPASVADLRLYPDPEAKEFRAALAAYYDLKPSETLVGNGSDELLAFSFMAFQNQGKKFYFPDITYGFYRVYGDIFGVDWTEIPLEKDFSLDPEKYYGLDGTIIIANPNAPTGRALSMAEIEGILKSNPENLVIIDEAYVDFGGETCIPLIKTSENLLVIQTMSKSRNLAGARIGMAFGREALIEDLNKMKYSFNPYNLNRLSLLAGQAAIEDREYFNACCSEIARTREKVASELTKLGFQVLPSKTNFLFVRPPRGGKDYLDYLRENGILVRYFDTPRLREYVRITIGKPEDMDRLLEITAAKEGENYGKC